MLAEVSMSQLYWNKSLIKFFMRSQAEETMMALLNDLEEEDSDLNYEELFMDIEGIYENLDDLEEDFYSLSVEEIREIIGR